MCISCWEGYGSPEIYNDKVKEALKYVEEHDRIWSLKFHAVLDDYNLEDRHLDWSEANEVMDASDLEFLKLFRTLTIEERCSTLAIRDGFFQPEGP